MAELSPQAQAVLDSTMGLAATVREAQAVAAAALRAAADQVVPLEKTPWGTTLIPVLTSRESRDRFLAIAAELENQ